MASMELSNGIARQKWRAWIETFELNYEIIHCRTGSLEIVAAGFFFGVAAKP